MKLRLIGLLMLCVFASCASKKQVLYLQDATVEGIGKINYQSAKIQPNDILKITVESSVPEAAIPYNKNITQGPVAQNIQILQLEGYLVSTNNTINFPVLGELSTANRTTEELQNHISQILKSGGHLAKPNVNVRLINAKVTILGEVNKPGTYNFTEQNITLLQALGYAGDLTINGKREDILLTREVDGVRKITHIDLTSASFMNGDFYFIKPNDVIVVNPNNPRVKNAGFIGDINNVLTIASLLLSVAILVSR
ncbi:polysaccharide biosynthesis/export family protein [Winogradskyella vincentii]|uniref:Polysaccharide biosynthesis/export family protein n=1 Tax=Winogradskyella vincentii TaxID=2877122 RepID=A0ABS7XXQ1_9FLAO|nr:polysaccharide biosynthesis/export family protein [Winogradskyella vincentii]MCA0151865.1 polysaccharide biosynthesis/export family protein [Winogradskyella vincentii]